MSSINPAGRTPRPQIPVQKKPIEGNTLLQAPFDVSGNPAAVKALVQGVKNIVSEAAEVPADLSRDPMAASNQIRGNYPLGTSREKQLLNDQFDLIESDMQRRIREMTTVTPISNASTDNLGDPRNQNPNTASTYDQDKEAGKGKTFDRKG